MNYVLIIASSGRMLAESARRAGMMPLIIDLFGDVDTREFAFDIQVVKGFDRLHLLPAVDVFLSIYPIDGFIYGSGLESQQECLGWISEKISVLGNHPCTFNNILDKKYFFSKLDELNIDYPETRFGPPVVPEGWLVKPYYSEGGAGIVEFDNEKNDPQPVYWQRFIKGQAMSALFLADGSKAEIIGFNTQWVDQDNHYPFIFSGVINQTELSAIQQGLIFRWIKKTVAEFSLTGLNSLDFIVNEQSCFMLEINPRPSASMVLYEPDYPNGLLFEHIRACRDGLEHFRFRGSQMVRGYQIIYARYDLTFPSGIKWSEWVTDRPTAGSFIRMDQPICSIIAVEKNANIVLSVLQQRTDNIYKLLT
mgnify:CR=1 FL=1